MNLEFEIIESSVFANYDFLMFHVGSVDLIYHLSRVLLFIDCRLLPLLHGNRIWLKDIS